MRMRNDAGDRDLESVKEGWDWKNCMYIMAVIVESGDAYLQSTQQWGMKLGRHTTRGIHHMTLTQ